MRLSPYQDLNSGATDQDAAEVVTCAGDAIFTLLEHAGVLGSAADSALAAYEPEGLTLGGQRAQVTFNDPDPLPSGPDCFGDHDVFALPASA